MLSIVVPVLNEVESLDQLLTEIDDVARSNDFDVEVIFVDDGSSDGSWDQIERLAAEDDRVRGIRFRRNFGKAAALSAGFDSARGELIITMDADLQDDPKEIPRFLEQMGNDLDVVSGWKQRRLDPWHKVYPSRIFNWLVGYLTGVKLHDHNCGFKCYRREIFEEVRLYGELHRFVPVLAAARGWRVGEIVVNHRPREHGHSKYGVTRIVKGFLDLLTVKFLTGFGQRPQHMLGTFGLCSFFVGLLGLTVLAALWGFSRLFFFVGLIGVGSVLHLSKHFPAVIYSLALLLMGVQLMSIGFVAELITAYVGKDTAAYSIKSRVGSWPQGEQDPSRTRPNGSSNEEP